MRQGIKEKSMSDKKEISQELPLITRKEYLGAQRCLKMLWKDRYSPQDCRPAEADEAMIEQAKEVKRLALSLFEGRKIIHAGSAEERCAETAALLDGTAAVIEGASFQKDGCYACMDLLEVTEEGWLRIYLIRSSLHMRASYLEDLSFQAWLLKELGYTVKNCVFMHLSEKYERVGELDLSALFVKEEMIKAVRKRIAKVPGQIERIRRALLSDRPEERKIGEYCLSSRRCGYYDSCFESPGTNSVFVLNNMALNVKMDLYHRNKTDLSVLLKEGKLNKAQALQARYELEDLPDHIEKDNIRQFLNGLGVPMYFLDFESFQPAVPLFDHTRPYDQVVFQYSLHILREIGGVPEHREFLAPPGEDTRRKLAESLCADIPASVPVIVYNEQYEKARIRELAALFGDLSEALLGIAGAIRDLAAVFQNRWYYSRAMHGRYSIKVVLPALFPDDPELNYENLGGIHEGQAASSAYLSMPSMSEEEQEECRRSLLAYCALDTLAMVKIVQKLERVTSDA